MPSKLANRVMIRLIESPLHSLVGPRLAVVRVMGQRTGRTYATPITVEREGDGWMVTSLRTRTWWRNLRHGRQGMLTVAGRAHSVEGCVVEERKAVKAGLAAYFLRHPKECRYFGIRTDAEGHPLEEDVRRAAADRVIIRLSPTPNPIEPLRKGAIG